MAMHLTQLNFIFCHINQFLTYLTVVTPFMEVRVFQTH